ncbi:unnamed protein product [Caenorhabditis angaria]|uniref:Exonuclease 1 n=1 Tax=Caenorhabditis angaria TaxID=860376 RepID=A0A9P1IHG1_9PELO|nr:unnamed protein product [Caenorhabditis angaria]
MGISGLLPYVKNACRTSNIRELAGKSVAVDVSCFLHKGLTGCMDKIHMGEDTQSYLYYVEKFILVLLKMDCHVVLVFDGRPLPAKKLTNDSRRETRDANIQSAEILLAKGLEREARDKFRIATKISPEIVENAIRFFRNRENVDIVVAPYEADAELAYLMKSKLVDALITEDSDLIVFGCEKIYFKWQIANGECTVYERQNLSKCFTGELSGDKFDFIKFRRICILSGCDYIPAGLPGVGLSKATNFFQKTSITDLPTLLKRIPSYLNAPKLKSLITSEFIENFDRAEKTFKYQIVFDPRERTQKPFENDGFSGEFQIFSGEILNQKLAQRLALGNVNIERESIKDEFLLGAKIEKWSIWSAEYISKGAQRAQKQLEEEKKKTTCCAFKLDSSSVQKKKRKIELSDDEDDIVKQFMEDVENSPKKKKMKVMEPISDSQSSITRKSLEILDIIELSPEKIEILEERKTEKVERKSEKAPVLRPTKSSPVKRAAEEEVIHETELRPPPILRKTISTPSTSKHEKFAKLEKFKSPIISTESLNSPSTSTSSTKRILGQSKYFTKNSPKLSNPFRCPAFIKPSPTPPLEKSTENADKPENIDEKVEVTSPFQTVGFKTTGLRRKN